jgi:hypothetical protein
VIGGGVVKFPPIEGLVKLLLVFPEDGDIDILVGTRLASHSEVQCPAPRYPPGRMEAAHQARKPGRIEVLPLPEIAVVEADHDKH